ncbi:MAG: CPBP family intramembrane metalloprotease [Parachlamydiaceae bacterium]|nr:CPBP family intramembrane metalloprotease [Parachlamydiaceae bacterium]
MPIETNVEVVPTIHDHAQLLLGAVLFFACTFLVAFRNHFFTLPYAREIAPGRRLHVLEVLGVFATFLSGMLIVSPLIAYIWISIQTGMWNDPAQQKLDEVTQSWVNLLGIAISSLAVFSYCMLLGSSARQTVWGARAWKGWLSAFSDIKIGMLTWFVCYPLVIVISQSIAIIISWFGFVITRNEQVAVKFLRMAMEHPVLLTLTAIFIVVVVPVVEEVLFRGFLQTWIKQLWGRSVAIVIASLTFALFHFAPSQGFDNVELITSLFVLACFLGFVYERQRSLWASIALHGTFNLVSVLAILLGA